MVKIERDTHGAMRDYNKQRFNLVKKVTLGFQKEATDELCRMSTCNLTKDSRKNIPDTENTRKDREYQGLKGGECGWRRKPEQCVVIGT